MSCTLSKVKSEVYMILKNDTIKDNTNLKIEIINNTNTNYYFPLDVYHKYLNDNFPNIEITTIDNSQKINRYSIDVKGRFPKQPFREKKDWLSNQNDFILIEKKSSKEINFHFSYSEDLSIDYMPSLYFYDFDEDFYNKKINSRLKGRIKYQVDSLKVMNLSKNFELLNDFHSKGYKCFHGTIFSNWIPVEPKKNVQNDLWNKYDKHFEE